MSALSDTEIQREIGISLLLFEAKFTSFFKDHKEVRKPVLRIWDIYPGSRILDPDFYPSRIPDPKTAIKERGEKFFFVIPFFVATNFTKLLIISFLKC
jgi:hypothetical protein